MSDPSPRPGGAGEPDDAARDGNRPAGMPEPARQDAYPPPYGRQGAYAVPAGYGPSGYPQQGYGYPPGPKSGLALTALILGIVAVVFAMIPVVGLLSFIIGLLALVFGIVALVQRQRKPMAVTGMVLGLLGILIAGAVTAFIAFFVSRTVGNHTVSYRVTTSQPATVTYYNGHETVDRQVSGSWADDFTFTGLPIGAVTVNVPGGHASCEVVLDGRPISQNSGNGRVECLSADLGDQQDQDRS
ncbi:hypothetical protein LVY72_03485 [Arthrobacter sp. I2-34]|uniref:DUF4190 domain-containing protein n=1 Tax=Arthrobacter hankyongi TaxID=2904801 RepID=A0ABS9L2Y9_9MICC|nr:DUF4190 domain-containing protein [Arthrobacter hankyongi]MCG2620975.1 hypothetical protein [Arthrobacter hankyongi]